MNDYIKLAELLYPNLKLNAEYYLTKYKKRDLPHGAEVTRFAPSPTGYMHIGNFYPCFIDSRIAKSTNGVFFMRLEDTDKKREVQGAGDIVVQVMKAFGVQPMEGLVEGGQQIGEYGPYIQSERLDIYHAFAFELVKNGRAFPCFCDKTEGLDDVEERREKMLESEATILEHDPCRDLTFDEIQSRIAEGKPWALRLRSMNQDGDKIVVNDAVLGDREIPANIKDVVLIKSDGIPPYAFAHAVDDHLMGTTLVVRGGEWFPSVAAHIEIFEALGFDKVKYAHTGLICKLDGENKRKLSKRKDPEADMRYFLREGYPVQAVVEYLLNLANSNFEIWRRENPDKSNEEFEFDIKKLNLSDPIFDLVKLEDISKNIIAKMSTEEVFGLLVDWAKQYDQKFYDLIQNNADYIKAILSIDRGGAKPRKDIVKMSGVYSKFRYMFEDDFDKEFDSKFTQEQINTALEAYIKTYNHSASKDEWFPNLKNTGAEIGYCPDMKVYKKNPQDYIGSVADYSNIVRVAVTGERNTPDLYTIMQLLGEEKVISRMRSSIRN